MSLYNEFSILSKMRSANYRNYNNISLSYSTNNTFNIKKYINPIISNGSTNTSSINSSYNSTLRKKESNSLIYEDIKDEPIEIQIKYALKNMANLYGKTNPNFFKSKKCKYYCGPFLNKDYFESNKEIIYKYSSSSIMQNIDEKDKNI